MAVATFEACHCQDYARVDIRVDANGVPWMLEINSMASLGLGGSYVMAAQAAGYSFDEIVNQIIAVALHRYTQRAAAYAPTPESTPAPMAMQAG